MANPGSNIPILFVDHASALGGAEHSLLRILKYLDRQQWQPHLACVEGGLAKSAAALKVSVHPVPMPRLRRSVRFLGDWLTGARSLAQLTQQVGAVLLYANSVRAALYCALAARLARRPFIWHMRDFWLSESRPRYLWADQWGKALLCGTATHILVNSHTVGTHLPCPKKITVIHNGIELEHFDSKLDGLDFRRSHGIPLSIPVVGMVGRLRPWKGQDCFLRMAAQIITKFPEVRFLIVGGDPFKIESDYPQYLYHLTANLGLADHVIFTDQISDVRPALAAMNLFVHPGAPEPFGLVNIEAMAMEKPVVAFAHGALPEIVANHTTGILVPPGDETGLAEAIMMLLGEPDRCLTMGQAGRIRVETLFTAEQMTNSVVSVLDQTVRTFS